MIVMGDSEQMLDRDEIILVQAKDVLYTRDLNLFTDINIGLIKDDIFTKSIDYEYTLKGTLKYINDKKEKNILHFFSEKDKDILDEKYNSIIKSYNTILDYHTTNIYSVVYSLLANNNVSKAYLIVDDKDDIRYIASLFDEEVADKIILVTDDNISNIIKKEKAISTIIIDDLDIYNNLVLEEVPLTNKIFLIADYRFNFKNDEFEPKHDIETLMMSSNSQVSFINLFDYNELVEPIG